MGEFRNGAEWEWMTVGDKAGMQEARTLGVSSTIEQASLHFISGAEWDHRTILFRKGMFSDLYFRKKKSLAAVWKVG